LQPPKESTEIDALVVGAGPVGLVAALELVRHGMSCRIIDRADQPSTTSKALVVFARTLETFDLMGIAGDFVEAGKKMRQLAFYRQQTLLAHLSFASLPSRYQFALGLPQSETERLLSQHLSRRGIVVERSTELTGLEQNQDCVQATVRTPAGAERRIETGWLVGCDGAHSSVRHLLGLDFQGASYQESFLLADVRLTGEIPDGDVILMFADEGVLGIFRFSEARARVIAQLTPASAEATGKPSLGTIQFYLQQRCPYLIKATDPSWISHFQISRRKVRKFRENRVFLAGDAAHIHSPAGGQGMNTGIQDAFNLIWKLALVAKQDAPLNLLESYNAEREPVARSVLKLTDYLTRVATSRNPIVQSARTVLMPLAGGVEQIADRITETMSELRVHYRRSPIVLSDHTGLLRAGDRAPDSEVQDPSIGKTVRFYDLFRSGRHLLLLFGGTASHSTVSPAPPLISLLHRFSRIADGAEIVCGAATPQDGYHVLGDSGMAHASYHVEEPTLFIVRPDGYIGLRTEAGNWSGVTEYFEKIMGAERVVQ
jgi:2-polyprenyl-6-methoxyphenol hydroxylase-like FAD-dependent oxidoreductase